MDPVSLILSSYIDIVSSNLSDKTTEIFGAEIQAVIVKHEGMQIPYSYQIWKIRPQSVCASYKGNISKYSKCTTKAKSLFRTTCHYLQSKKNKHWKYRKTKNMYCHAAISYKPTIAAIGWTGKKAKPENTYEFREARAQCNAAIAGSMNNTDQKAQKKINAACKKYNTLKKKE